MTAPRVLIASTLFALALAAPAAHAAGKPYRIAGAEKDAVGKWQPVDVMEAAQRGVLVQAKFLDAESRRDVLRSALGRDLDLLPGRVDERRPGYLVFLVQLNNTSAEDVHFNPGMARLATDKGDMKIALDYTALYEIARRFGGAAPTLDEIDEALFDRGTVIRPGGSVRKLMAFEAPREDRYRTIDVMILELNVGAASVDFHFPFRKFRE